MTSDLVGSMPDQAGPAHSRSWVWSSTSTSPGDLAWDDASESEPTIEDTASRPTSAESSPTFSAVVGQMQGLEESGDFDLAPLRHLLEQGWADPGTARSKADYQPTSPRSGAWHSQEAQAEVETMEVKTVVSAPPSPPAPQPVATAPAVMALPSEADFPDLVMDHAGARPAPRPIAPPPPKSGRSWKPAVLAAAGAGLLTVCAVPLVLMSFKDKPASSPKRASVAAVKPAGASGAAVKSSIAEQGEQPPLAVADPVVEEEAAPQVRAPLDWSGVPEGSKIFWQGKKAQLSALGTAAPGSYDVKVVAPGRPAVRFALAVGQDSQGVAVGQKVSEALSKQPTLSLALAKTPKGAVQVRVRELGEGASFKTSTKLQGKTASGLVLPKAGKYKVEVAETDTHRAYGQTVTVGDGSKKSLQIALKAAPPKVVVSAPPAPSYSGGGGGYSEPTYYAPPPPRYHGGGGGGGGGSRIAPPSF